VGSFGADGRKYIPFIITFWMVIFFSNVVALFVPVAPTADLSFNLGMALCSIGYVQYEGMKANGVFGHLKHFAGPKLGLAMIPITLMIFMIEVISEVMKNLSLTLRLFGNIDGGHQAAEAMSKLAGGAAGVHWIPAGTLLVPVKFLTCVVQAMIFCLLTCVYLSLVTHHEEEGAHAH
ncbi:MAG: F0F1 ATP synthase subunit A, partial [Armatimonadota bacterium]